MTWSPVTYGPNEMPHYAHSNRGGFHKYNQYFYTRVGVIVDVDFDKYEMTVQWASETGQPTRIPMSLPYAGPASCIGGVAIINLEWPCIWRIVPCVKSHVTVFALIRDVKEFGFEIVCGFVDREILFRCVFYIIVSYVLYSWINHMWVYLKMEQLWR